MKTSTLSYRDTVAEIRRTDETLDILRESWLDAADPAKKLNWMRQINQRLDTRSKLMKRRDETELDHWIDHFKTP